MAELNAMVRTGIVSDVKASEGKARVYYPDMDDMVSDWLYVMRYPGLSVSIVSKGAHTHDDAVISDGRHSHNVNMEDWMPRVNDTVLVLYAYGHNADGYILGVIQ